METVKFICKKFNVDTSQDKIELMIGRFKDVPRLFRKLGFKKGVEVGVYRGLYSMWLFRMIPGINLTGVDKWEVYGDYKDYNLKDIKEAEKEAKLIYKKYGGKIIKDWSRDAVKKFKDESLDFVFIDGNHAYEYVVEDIALWSKKVKKGGIVYGHDYDDYSTRRRWKDMNVINAVDGWVKSYKIKPLFIIAKNTNKSWMYVK